jgi:hypothetical protein
MMIENHPSQGTAEAITQLAVAMASDRDMVATLAATNANIASQIEASQAYIKKLKDNIMDLKMIWNPHDKVNGLPRSQTTTSIVGGMAVKSATNAQAQRAKISRTDIRKRPQRETQWAELSGARNDVEGQLRL